MTSRNAANSYQRQRVHGASPVGLIVLLYDTAIESLRRAKRAAESAEIEDRVAASNHVLLIINELSRALDHEHGGGVARNLDRFYAVARARLMEANVRSDPGVFDQLIGMFCSMREGWQRVELEVGIAPPASAASGASAVADEAAGVGWSA